MTLLQMIGSTIAISIIFFMMGRWIIDASVESAIDMDKENDDAW